MVGQQKFTLLLGYIHKLLGVSLVFGDNHGDNTKQLIGVCSYGLADCQNWAPEVYTKVAHPRVLAWMRETMGVEELSMENCGVTNPRDRNTETWIEKAMNFFEGKQVY